MHVNALCVCLQDGIVPVSFEWCQGLPLLHSKVGGGVFALARKVYTFSYNCSTSMYSSTLEPRRKLSVLSASQVEAQVVLVISHLPGCSFLLPYQLKGIPPKMVSNMLMKVLSHPGHDVWTRSFRVIRTTCGSLTNPAFMWVDSGLIMSVSPCVSGWKAVLVGNSVMHCRWVITLESWHSYVVPFVYGEVVLSPQCTNPCSRGCTEQHKPHYSVYA